MSEQSSSTNIENLLVRLWQLESARRDVYLLLWQELASSCDLEFPEEFQAYLEDLPSNQG